MWHDRAVAGYLRVLSRYANLPRPDGATVRGLHADGDGWGGPGYLIPSEDNAIPFQRGSVGIATSGYDTGGSQFFICQSAQPHLTGNYTLFGQVIEGMSAVDIIEPGDEIIQITIESD